MMPPKKQSNPNEYSEENIVYLEPRKHVRKVPALYIGGTGKRALHNMIWQVLDDAISELENTTYNEITISLLPNKTICISDNGLGIPVARVADSAVSWLQEYMTIMGERHIGRQKPKDFGYYHIGINAVNALSSICVAEVKRDGFLWRQTYSEGNPTSALEQIRPLETDEATGTNITFRPDFTIMDENDFDFDLITNRCQQLAYLLPQLRFTIVDKREEEQEISFHYPQGLIHWVKKQSELEAVMIAPLSIFYDCELIDKQDKSYLVKVHLAFQWLWDERHLLSTYVNTIETTEGGTHVEGLIAALCKALQIRSWQNLRQGFVGIIHILHPDPQFESQTRIRLLNSDLRTAIDEAVEALFAAHPEAKAAIQAHFNRSE